MLVCPALLVYIAASAQELAAPWELGHFLALQSVTPVKSIHSVQLKGQSMKVCVFPAHHLGQISSPRPQLPLVALWVPGQVLLPCFVMHAPLGPTVQYMVPPPSPPAPPAPPAHGLLHPASLLPLFVLPVALATTAPLTLPLKNPALSIHSIHLLTVYLTLPVYPAPMALQQPPQVQAHASRRVQQVALREPLKTLAMAPFVCHAQRVLLQAQMVQSLVSHVIPGSTLGVVQLLANPVL